MYDKKWLDFQMVQTQQFKIAGTTIILLASITPNPMEIRPFSCMKVN
jgi:hypothetical protein